MCPCVPCVPCFPRFPQSVAARGLPSHEEVDARWVGWPPRSRRFWAPMALQRGGYRPPSECPFPRSCESGGVGATSTRASQVKFDFAKARTRNGFPRACMRFPSIISTPFRSLSPQRLPPPPDTGSAAALPPGVPGGSPRCLFTGMSSSAWGLSLHFGESRESTFVVRPA